MMGRHGESESWGGMRRVGRRYLSCSALAAMAFRCAAAKPRNWMCATPPAAAAKPRHWMCAAPPARTPSVFFRSMPVIYIYSCLGARDFFHCHGLGDLFLCLGAKEAPLTLNKP